MKLKPLQDWAVIQRLEPEEKTAGGIIIPESAKEKPTEGIVLAIGPGKFETEKGKEKEKGKKKEKKFVPTVVKPGQRIIYGKYSAREIEVDGETIILVREEDMLGTVEETGLAEKKPSAVAEKNAQPLAVKKDKAVSKPSQKPEKEKETATEKKKQTAKKPLAKGKPRPKE